MKIDWDEEATCPDCDGEGGYWVSVDRWCHRTGHTTDDTGHECERCGGSGEVEFFNLTPDELEAVIEDVEV